MDLDQDRCYRALKSRDARFDGQFFTAVRTTGVYCRPICPAPTPKRRNVTFYACAAAAQEAGYRPCLRCRPETSPGTPAWQGTSATVSRALRLIGEGALDEGSVEALGDRLGVGGRHLRRLFMEHLGVTPVAVAQTRRLHFAKKLIDETPLSMSDIAFSAGYSSIRRFNTAFKNVYGRPPREMRRASDKSPPVAGAPLKLRLTYRPPFDWDGLLAFFTDRATAGIESVQDGTYRRSFQVGDTIGTMDVGHEPDKRALTLSLRMSDARYLQSITARVRQMFDLESDPSVIAAALRRDPFLRPVLKKHPGLRVPGAWDPFELAVRVILGQQISVKGATTLAGRVAKTFGRPLGEFASGDVTHLSPRPEDLADADLGGLGIVGARIRAIQEMARAMIDGRVRLDGSMEFDEAVAAIVALPGLGPWSAHVIAMRVLREPDAFPAADLGIIRALSEDEKKPSPREVLARSEKWSPWRAYAALYLWRMPPAAPPKVPSAKPSRRRKTV